MDGPGTSRELGCLRLACHSTTLILFASTMKVDIQQTLDSLKPALTQRLKRVLDHLRQTAWPEPLHYTGPREPQPNPNQWDRPLQHHTDMTRAQAYAWAHREVSSHFETMPTAHAALRLIDKNAAKLVSNSLATLAACVEGMVAKDLRLAVLNRERLVAEWPWTLDSSTSGTCLHWLLSHCPPPAPDPLFTLWPPDAFSHSVAHWADQWLAKYAMPLPEGTVTEIMAKALRIPALIFSVRPGFPFRRLATPALALLYLLETDVREKQQRPFIAIDTCKEHTKLVEAWRDLPKSTRTPHRTSVTNGRLELILPDQNEKRHFQLSLTLDDDPLAYQVAAVLRRWRSWEGLRHWITFQSLLTANKRLGWVRWTVQAHLEAMNLSKEWCRRLEVRRGAAEMVELFTKIEIGIYDERGVIRERRPLITKGSTFERLVGSQWEIEGLQLKVNELLYRGIRDPDTGKLGKNWWPTPNELPHIDHRNYGAAIALGIALPARWRMELGQSGKPYIDLKGESLLRAAGLPYQQRNVTATWRSIERNLTELKRRGGVEHWHWHGNPDLGTICRLYAPTWAVDRIARGVPPAEKKAPPTALTGSELKAWRKQENLTQATAATKLAVTKRTIQRAEATPEKPLTTKLRTALATYTSSISAAAKTEP